MKKNNLFLNNRGIGLVGALVAAAMVVTIAMTVAYVVSDQHKQAKKIQISGSCENIANSLVEFIKKDETSLFITSYGPSGGNSFPAGLDQTDDGIDRFRFFGSASFPGSGPAIPMYTGSGNMSLSPTASSLPPGWNYYNYLNIKNSTNRLIALAASGNYCCNGLDMMGNPNCGAPYYNNNLQRPGFTISERNVEVDLAVDFDGIPCTSRRLAIADLPNSTESTRAEFKVKVVMERGTDKEKTCVGTGTVQRNADTTPAQTLIQYETNLCAGSVTSPAVCGAPVPIRIALRTFKSNAGTACQTACQQAVTSASCSAVAGSGPDLFDTFNNAACAACIESEPGTAFLCRIGEKSWMDNPANANVWQPCETATVKDFDGSTTGTVTIDYNPLVAGNTTTQRTSNAVLTISGLRSMRGYVVDVRTVDTSGNVGPSFCGPSGSPSCNPTSPAHFTIIDSVPVMGAIADIQNFVGAAGQPTGRQSPALSTVTPPKYNTALNAFGSSRFQCASGSAEFQGTVQYTPPLPVGPAEIPHTCSGTLVAPGGGTTNIPSMTDTTNPGCNCVGAECTARLPSVSTEGGYTLRLSAQNPCGALPAIPDENWCLDRTNGAAPAYAPISSFGNTPNFSATISPISTAVEPCGVATLCPNTDGSFVPTLGTTCNTFTTWNAATDSGCLRDPNGNFCAVVTDPCGRYRQTNSPPAQYSTLLRGVPHTSPPSSHECFSFGGQQVGGNSCEAGSYCSRLGKCLTSCAKAGTACTLASDCDDPSYGVTSAQAGGPNCVANRCTCPTNSSTPANGDCSQRYCPVVSSCTTSITPSNDGNTACAPPSNWNVGAWSALCVGGTRTRTVTCPTAVCVGPRPADTVTCPDCVTPWGTNLTHGSSVTAYQQNNVLCPLTCLSETRTCNNGIMSGSYTNQNCTVTPCANSCAANPACTGIGCALTPGTPVSVNQAWVKGSLSCGFNCINGYTGANCEIPPPNTCASPAPCTNGTQCTLTVGTPTIVDQPWVSGAPNCGFVCINGYSGATCQTPPANNCVLPAPCTNGTQCTLTVGTPTIVDQPWVASAPNCGFVCLPGYSGATCQVPPPNTCPLPWGGSIADGANITAYQTPTVACGNTCASENRTCTAGTLSGTYNNAACTVDACACTYVPPRPECFVAGTQITLEDGSTKSIEDINVGDKVSIFDEETGERKVSPVTEILHHKPRKQMMYEFEFSNGKNFIVTAEHLIFTLNEGYVRAATLFNDYINKKQVYVMDEKSRRVGIIYAKSYIDEVPTYNIHVQGVSNDISKYGRNGRGHNYFANGILAHNVKWCCPGCTGMPGDDFCCSNEPPHRIDGTGVQCRNDRIDNAPGDDMCGNLIIGSVCMDLGGSPGCGTVNVTGVCGSANGTPTGSAPSGGSLCNQGTATAVTGTGPWTWTCIGEGTGSDSPECSAPVGGALCTQEQTQSTACFIAGTKVTLAGGKDKNIEDIVIGDYVKTYDEQLEKITVSRVEEILHHTEAINELYTFKFSNQNTVTSNDVHLFFSVKNKNYLQAKIIYNLWMNGDNVTLLSDKNEVVDIVDIKKSYKNVKLYNIHVTSTKDTPTSQSKFGHNYFANGVLVHNIKAWNDLCEQVGKVKDPGGNWCMPGDGIYRGFGLCCVNSGGIPTVWDNLPGPSFNRGIECEIFTAAECASLLACSATADCTIAANTAFSWTVGGNSCNYTSGATTISDGATLAATDAGAPTTGNANFQCNNGVISTTIPNGGATCNAGAPCAGSGQPSTVHTCNGATGEVWATDSSCCDDTSYCEGPEPFGTAATCGIVCTAFNACNFGCTYNAGGFCECPPGPNEPPLCIP